MAHDAARRGGRDVWLYLPFDSLGVRIECVSIEPFELDHTLRWGRGVIPTSVALLVEMTGLREDQLRRLKYPDVDRVMSALLELAPEAIREDIRNGVVPAAGDQPAPDPRVPASERGGQASAQEEAIRLAEGPRPQRPLDFVPGLDDDPEEAESGLGVSFGEHDGGAGP